MMTLWALPKQRSDERSPALNFLFLLFFIFLCVFSILSIVLTETISLEQLVIIFSFCVGILFCGHQFFYTLKARWLVAKVMEQDDGVLIATCYGKYFSIKKELIDRIYSPSHGYMLQLFGVYKDPEQKGFDILLKDGRKFYVSALTSGVDNLRAKLEAIVENNK